MGLTHPILLSAKKKNRVTCPPLRACGPLPLPDQSARAPRWVTRIEHDEDDVGLVDEFVQHADASIHAAVPFVLWQPSYYRRRVGRGRRDVVSRCRLGHWASKCVQVSDRFPERPVQSASAKTKARCVQGRGRVSRPKATQYFFSVKMHNPDC